ncbi:putative nadh:ubiquinone oxidoreductase subunit protein [Daldinia childiae]|uniref:putative nadh:ubiquinone oxidoreductase subunit protein n=1 Tax=Daldinia childiae TaxID=326645 RepID=UPI00144743F0|nr:putative nadh:ubiquinone oxidoreductase subunit protein [Daldinia childiae]KAF3059532.1 putative nadh:ubiquinone oxidoreductase subunit protein [Daldinia childiae]
MAGLEHYRMSMDPAIQKLGNMTTNRHKFFRWTPRTARITFMYAIVVPAIFTVVAYTTDGKYELRAKRKGDLIKEF